MEWFVAKDSIFELVKLFNSSQRREHETVNVQRGESLSRAVATSSLRYGNRFTTQCLRDASYKEIYITVANSSLPISFSSFSPVTIHRQVQPPNSKTPNRCGPWRLHACNWSNIKNLPLLLHMCHLIPKCGPTACRWVSGMGGCRSRAEMNMASRELRLPEGIFDSPFEKSGPFPNLIKRRLGLEIL